MIYLESKKPSRIGNADAEIESGKDAQCAKIFNHLMHNGL